MHTEGLASLVSPLVCEAVLEASVYFLEFRVGACPLVGWSQVLGLYVKGDCMLRKSLASLSADGWAMARCPVSCLMECVSIGAYCSCWVGSAPDCSEFEEDLKMEATYCSVHAVDSPHICLPQVSLASG